MRVNSDVRLTACESSKLYMLLKHSGERLTSLHRVSVKSKGILELDHIKRVHQTREAHKTVIVYASRK